MRRSRSWSDPWRDVGSVSHLSLVMLSLDRLPIGQPASIAAIQGNDALSQRLLEMGLLEGEQLTVVGRAPLGDPLDIQLRDYRLSLRRQEAARILVISLP